MRLETKQETLIVSLFSCFCLELARLFRVAGRSGMTYVAWIVAVFFVKPGTDVVVKTGTDAEKVH